MVFSMKFTNNNAVFKWLQDVRIMNENECLCVLQAKSFSNKHAYADKTKSISPNVSSKNSSKLSESYKSQSNLSSKVLSTTSIDTNSTLSEMKESQRNTVQRKITQHIFQFLFKFELILGSIQSLRNKSNNISVEFTKIIRRMEQNIWHHTSHSIKKLNNYVRSVLNDFNKSLVNQADCLNFINSIQFADSLLKVK